MKPHKSGPVPVTPGDWLKHARSDLNMAKTGAGRDDILHEQVCFHAQQATEKALKSFLLYNKINFPLTHDLQELTDILEACHIPLPPGIDRVGILTPYAVETRYPGFWGEITDEDVKEAIDLAEKVLLWVGDATEGNLS